MKAVIVNADMEPITIVELTPQMVRILREPRGELMLACMDPLRADHNPLVAPRMRTVRLWPVVRQLTILQTHDEVDALTLQATFLAGQQSAVRDVYDSGRKKGAGETLELISGLIPRPGVEG